LLSGHAARGHTAARGSWHGACDCWGSRRTATRSLWPGLAYPCFHVPFPFLFSPLRTTPAELGHPCMTTSGNPTAAITMDLRHQRGIHGENLLHLAVRGSCMTGQLDVCRYLVEEKCFDAKPTPPLRKVRNIYPTLPSDELDPPGVSHGPPSSLRVTRSPASSLF
jgi:hypothetical protein